MTCSYQWKLHHRAAEELAWTSYPKYDLKTLIADFRKKYSIWETDTSLNSYMEEFYLAAQNNWITDMYNKYKDKYIDGSRFDVFGLAKFLRENHPKSDLDNISDLAERLVSNHMFDLMPRNDVKGLVECHALHSDLLRQVPYSNDPDDAKIHSMPLIDLLQEEKFLGTSESKNKYKGKTNELLVHSFQVTDDIKCDIVVMLGALGHGLMYAFYLNSKTPEYRQQYSYYTNDGKRDEIREGCCNIGDLSFKTRFDPKKFALNANFKSEFDAIDNHITFRTLRYVVAYVKKNYKSLSKKYWGC